MEERFESISAMTKADDVLLKWILVKDYEYWERWLQNRYSDKNRYFKELKGNGGTEVFALHWLEVLDCMAWMEIIKQQQKPRTWLLGLFLLTALFFTITWEVWDFGNLLDRFTTTLELSLGTFAVATTVGMFFWLAYMALTWVEGVDPDYGRADIFADPLDTEEELAPDPEGFDGVETQGENFIRYEGSVKANPESPKKNSIDLEIS